MRLSAAELHEGVEGANLSGTRRLNVLLVGNYRLSAQQSMERFARLTERLLGETCTVRLVQPPVAVGRITSRDSEVAKWFGYVDRFVGFRALLARELRWADVMHIADQGNGMYAHWTKKPTVVTCHDMLAIRSAHGEIPEHTTRWSGQVLQRWILSGLRKATHVVCDSIATQTDCVRLTGLSRSATSVVPVALNYPYRPMAGGEAWPQVARIGIPEAPFFLHVGGNQWYKNRAGVIRAFAALASEPRFASHRLVLAGKDLTADLNKLITKVGLVHRILNVVNISNEDLRALYSVAQALLFPSLAEGFGWPIVEAQACGCVVVTSNRSPMTSVGGDAAVYADPTDVKDIARAVIDAMARKEQLSHAGIANARGFSEQAMAEGYLGAYNAAIRLRRADSKDTP